MFLCSKIFDSPTFTLFLRHVFSKTISHFSKRNLNLKEVTHKNVPTKLLFPFNSKIVSPKNSPPPKKIYLRKIVAMKNPPKFVFRTKLCREIFNLPKLPEVKF